VGNVLISLKYVLNVAAFVGHTSASMLKGQRQEDGIYIDRVCKQPKPPWYCQNLTQLAGNACYWVPVCLG